VEVVVVYQRRHQYEQHQQQMRTTTGQSEAISVSTCLLSPMLELSPLVSVVAVAHTSSMHAVVYFQTKPV
jgi:hypothetical protein